jgi:hypothetical protein
LCSRCSRPGAQKISSLPDPNTRTAVREELTRFTRAGLLDEERSDADPRVYYVRTDSPLWGIIRAARAVVKTPDADS